MPDKKGKIEGIRLLRWGNWHLKDSRITTLILKGIKSWGKKGIRRKQFSSIIDNPAPRAAEARDSLPDDYFAIRLSDSFVGGDLMLSSLVLQCIVRFRQQITHSVLLPCLYLAWRISLVKAPQTEWLSEGEGYISNPG